MLDRFWVRDPDFAGQPPQERLDAVNRSLVAVALRSGGQAAGLPPHLAGGPARLGLRRPAARTQVNTDNSTSSHFTIIDVITLDRTGLLYAITRTLFEMGLSVWRAKIGTYLDQVVDVFYVTDRPGPQDRGRIAAGGDSPPPGRGDRHAGRGVRSRRR